MGRFDDLDPRLRIPAQAIAFVLGVAILINETFVTQETDAALRLIGLLLVGVSSGDLVDLVRKRGS